MYVLLQHDQYDEGSYSLCAGIFTTPGAARDWAWRVDRPHSGSWDPDDLPYGWEIIDAPVDPVSKSPPYTGPAAELARIVEENRAYIAAHTLDECALCGHVKVGERK